MNIFYESLFFFALFMIFYVYLGYPILVYILSIFNKRPVRKAACEPFVTIIIAAYNEENSIANTIDNKLEQHYSKDKLEIIVVSDSSTDKTDDVVRQYELQGVKLLRQEPRAGKTSALNMAVREATGEVLVFSDANSMYALDALSNLVQSFEDPAVGYVTGKMIYTNPDGSPIGDGCSSYMKYENFLRNVETSIGSIVGVDGGIDAIRKKLYQPMNPDQLPDFVLPLKVVEQGFRVVYEPRSVLKEPSLKSADDEYKMRVRVSLRAFWALSDMRKLLSLKNKKLFAFQLWSHKVLRYLCFVFLIIAYFTNLILWFHGSFFKVFFILQNIAYLGATVSPMLGRRGNYAKILYLARYFMLLNLASANAFIKFLQGHKQVVWTPRKG